MYDERLGCEGRGDSDSSDPEIGRDSAESAQNEG
jgi:hypothetical protein